MSKLFGFAQFDFAGTLPLADGRYLARDEEGESVLVILTLGAPSPPPRRRRRAHNAEPEVEALPLARVTAIRAFAPFADAEEAARWLDEATEAEDTTDVLVGDGVALLNRALYAQAAAAAEPHGHELTPERAVKVRLGYGTGDQLAESDFTEAREIDVRSRSSSRSRRRQEALRPQERVAAVLGGREQLDACETLLLRARADLDAGRIREAALQLRVGLEALLAELKGALEDPDHEADMGTLTARRSEAGEAANVALDGELDPTRATQVRELLELCERVLRRRRVLRG
ncbi:MAG TPA: hypothetical protein VFY48_04415 [Solirubrobacterales bacterium]|nr:hypothetical protein [Solirubrobacterales bacterium]